MKTATTKNVRKLLAIALVLLLALAPTALLSFAASDVDLSGATAFVFSDSGVSVTEGAYTGYKVKGTALTINAAGTYIVSGACANGSIVVKKNVTGVTLVLNGLTLTASATAPLTCNKGSGVTIYAAAGTVNTLTDDKYNNDDIYTDETLYPDIENAVIKCKDGSKVTICGAGAIIVNANGKNGIKGGADLYEEDAGGNATSTLLSEASLTIKDVTLTIDATVNDALKSEKELNIVSGTITVSAADDGIKSDYVLNIGAEGSDGPTINIKKSYEGMEGATINVYSGAITVNASNDGINAANSDLSHYSFSYHQYGGYVYVNCSGGDGIDSNGTLNLYGGTLEVYGPASGDGEPLDAESAVNFAGATVLAVGQNQMNQPLASNGAAYVTFGGNSGGMGGFGGMFGGASSSTLVSAGNTVTVKDSSGNTLYTAQSKAPRSASYVIFSAPALTNGGSYSLYNGSSSAGTSTATTASQGGFGGQGSGQPGGHQSGQGGFPGGNSGSHFLSLFTNLIQKILAFFQQLFNFN